MEILRPFSVSIKFVVAKYSLAFTYDNAMVNMFVILLDRFKPWQSRYSVCSDLITSSKEIEMAANSLTCQPYRSGIDNSILVRDLYILELVHYIKNTQQ